MKQGEGMENEKVEVMLSRSASGVSLVNCTVTSLSDEKRENVREFSLTRTGTFTAWKAA